jgi:hypothetical protein
VSLLVLDTSAIVVYVEGSIHVGEPIAEVHGAGGTVVVPVVCLVEAARKVGDDMLRVLIDGPAREVAPLVGERWAAVASGVRVLDRLDLAVALLEASTRRGFLLTGEPDAYGDPGADYVIPI